jgi:hypothetical protein
MAEDNQRRGRGGLESKLAQVEVGVNRHQVAVVIIFRSIEMQCQ